MEKLKKKIGVLYEWSLSVLPTLIIDVYFFDIPTQPPEKMVVVLCYEVWKSYSIIF